MNYIAEVNSFYNWVLCNSIPADAQALWHLLMQMNNRCAVKINNEWYWRVEFTVPNKTIVSMLTFSRQQLDRMRNVLIQTGRIEYKKGKGSQGGTYKIIPFDDSLVDNFVDNFSERVWITVSHNVTQTVTQPVTQSGHNPIHKTNTNGDLCNIIGTLTNNSNNNINNIYNNSFDDGDIAHGMQQTEPLSDYLSELNKYFGISESVKHEATIFTRELFDKYAARQPTKNDIIHVFERTMKSNRESDGSWILWLDKDKKEILEYAFAQAADSGNGTWAYIRGVLDNIRARDLKTRSDCEYYDVDRDMGKKHI